MSTTKLTLSVEKSLIEVAKQIASSRRTSVSAMFARFLRSVAQVEGDASVSPAPLTRQATGLIKLPRSRSDQDLVAEALSVRYRGTK